MSPLVAFVHAVRFVAVLSFAVVASAATMQGAEPLTWKFSPGLTNRYQMTQETKVDKTGAGGDVQTDSTLTIDMSWTVKEVKPDGSAVLDQKIERMRMTISTSDGMQSSIDTAVEEPPQGQAAMAAPLLKAITGNAFTITMTPRGEVTDVVVPKGVAEALKNQPGAAQMGELASAEGFKRFVSQASFVLPEKLKPGEKWTSASAAKLPVIGTQTAITTYQYEGPVKVDEQELEKFSSSVEVSFAGGDAAVEVPSQQSNGEILFNREAGRLESSQLSQATNLKITAAGQVVEQQIDYAVKVKWVPEEKR